jgi:hypothetical protein
VRFLSLSLSLSLSPTLPLLPRFIRALSAQHSRRSLMPINAREEGRARGRETNGNAVARAPITSPIARGRASCEEGEGEGRNNRFARER